MRPWDTVTHKVCTEPTCVLSPWWTVYGKPWQHCEKCKGTGWIRKYVPKEK